MYSIVETFYTLQGEGKYAGVASFFIRFYRCNLSCDFGEGMVCDDKAHTNPNKRTMFDIDELCDMVKASGTKHVVLTGGEVSLQNVNPLIVEIQRLGITVQVETNGTNYDNIAKANYITYSPKSMFSDKAPEMKFGFHELKLLAGKNNPVDVEKWASVKNKYVSPIGYENSWNMENVKYCIEFVMANPDWKLSTQNHKVWGIR